MAELKKVFMLGCVLFPSHFVQKAEEHEREQHRTFNPLTAANDIQKKKVESAKPLKRIAIEEVGSSASEDEAEPNVEKPAPASTPVEKTAAKRPLEPTKVKIAPRSFAQGQIKTSLQFESAWKDVKGDVSLQTQLLQV
jgi:hypothetical protein